MDEFVEQLHRTWLEFLITANLREVAALVVDADLSLIRGNFQNDGMVINFPPATLQFLQADSSYWDKLEQTLQLVAKRHFTDQNGFPLDEIDIQFRMRLADLSENWRAVIKEQIVNAKDSNQGLVSEKVLTRKGRHSRLTINDSRLTINDKRLTIHD